MYVMPIARCLLPIAYCLLPIACCPLPIAYCALPSVCAHLTDLSKDDVLAIEMRGARNLEQKLRAVGAWLAELQSPSSQRVHKGHTSRSGIQKLDDWRIGNMQ